MYEIVRISHILGACILFGTGMGIAFFMLMAHRSQNITALAITLRHVVIADFLFTAVAVAVQPATGAFLIYLTGTSWTDLWVWLSLLLYVFVGLCWLPVVWIQKEMRDMASDAMAGDQPLGPRYHRYFRIWFALGWPAFISVMAIIALMVIKPV